LGFKTLVGYNGPKEDYQNLPQLAESVIDIPSSGDNHSDNMYYARNYSIWRDLELLFKNLSRLA